MQDFFWDSISGWVQSSSRGVMFAFSAAMILQKEDFGFPEGVGIIFVVLTVNQIAYLVGATLAGPEDQ